MATAAKLMTVEEFLALPDDGVERDLINGELHEWGRPVTRRNRDHSRTTTRLAHLLETWVEARTEPIGEVVTGEAGFILGQDRDAAVGIDIAVVGLDVLQATPANSAYFQGPPLLAVEILSPSDTVGAIHEKVKLYMASGVALVWLIEPSERTVRVHRPGTPPTQFNETQDLSGEPHLPGFRVPVASLFGARRG